MNLVCLLLGLILGVTLILGLKVNNLGLTVGSGLLLGAGIAL